MAIRKFQDVGLSKYYFDTDKDCVMSLHSGEPRPLKWSKPTHWAPRRVSMVKLCGIKVSCRYDQIQRMLKPAEIEVSSKPVKSAEPQCVTNSLALVKPAYDYVVFSKANRCSQYFFAGTSLQEAMDGFARRGEVLKPSEIRIVNANTGQLVQLTVRTVETYSLV